MKISSCSPCIVTRFFIGFTRATALARREKIHTNVSPTLPLSLTLATLGKRTYNAYCVLQGTGKKMRMMSAFHMYTVYRCAIPMIQMLWSSHCTRSVITIPIFGDRNNHVDRTNSRETGKRKYQDDPIAV